MSKPHNFHDGAYRLGHTSGFGSVVASTSQYRNVIEDFIRLNNVRTVLDLACGDWQFSRYMPWDYYKVSYLGLDVSTFIIEKNTREFSSEYCRFGVIEHPSELDTVGAFDLVLCKDALQHMPNETIEQYLSRFEAISRFALITNDILPVGSGLNTDTHDGGWRAIDIREAPFSRKSSVLAEYHNAGRQTTYIKQVHLMHGRQP